MTNENITFKKLIDYNRLPEVYKLVHDTFVEGKYIYPRPNGIFDLHSHLDGIKPTTVVVAEVNGEIIATNSITLDGKQGLHTDKFFKKETDKLRQEHENIGSSWRIATNKKFRGNNKLIIDLIKYSLVIGEELGMKTCLFLFQERHSKIYERLIGAKPISKKNFNMESSPEFQKTYVLMKADVKKISSLLSNIG